MDSQSIQALYTVMYDAMIAKDDAGLSEVLDDSFVLIHMTGMKQTKSAFIRAVLDGTLNYFSARHEHMDVTVTGNTATLVGQSYVAAAVFGGGKHNWCLQQTLTLRKISGGWTITKSVASTY
ncbi:MAG: nuclear transport factor 2 family protein [Oscillospiraceae bacterium]|nr:nuclear transport factor 2 family protein [Oscillospiraceae bacterium]